jgi:GcrA cell cycle regulator
MNFGSGSWTDERVEELRKLHKEGLPASQISKQLGCVTRNAVISKCVRLGLGPIGGGKPSAPKKLQAPPVARAPHQNNGVSFKNKKPPMPKGAGFVLPPMGGRTQGNPAEVGMEAAKANAAARAAPRPETIDAPGLATVITLGAHMCKWPIGDPRDETFTFCGKRADGGRYCDAHTERARQPVRGPHTPKELERSLRRYV